MNKEAHQLAVFQEFIESSRLAVDPNSIKSLQPPMPDISCSIDGQTLLFELTRGADQDIANDIGELLSPQSTRHVGQFLEFNDTQILVDAVKKKASKTYETNGCPVDLLVYFDGTFHYPYMDIGELQPTLKSLQDEYKHKWTHIWFYDCTSRTSLH